MKTRFAASLIGAAVLAVVACPDDVGYTTFTSWAPANGAPPSCYRTRSVLTDNCFVGIGDETECYIKTYPLAQQGIYNPTTRSCEYYQDFPLSQYNGNATRDCGAK